MIENIYNIIGRSDPQPPRSSSARLQGKNLGGSADLIIIGAGPGGYRAAELAAKGGLRVVIVEGAHVGGTCLNEGCIPTKCYARNAEVLSLTREAATFGITTGDTPAFSLEQARQRKDTVIETLRSGVETLLSHPNITLERAKARFVDAHTVALCPVSGDTIATAPPEATETTLTAPYIIIATGSVPKTLPISIAPDCPVLDSSDLLRLDRLPHRLCIVGAGVIGMEFASIFSAFGTEVTVVEFLKECLPALDSDIAKRLRKTLERRGVTFCLQSAVTSIALADGQKVVTFNDKKGRPQTVEADEVLMAVGRAPRVSNDLALAGIDYDQRRGIHVDEHLQTSLPGVYAIGDVNGLQMLAHAAEAQAKLVVDHILHSQPSPLHTPLLIPAAIFTYPEAACVGFSEDQLKADGTPYECRKAFHRANGKALAMGEPEGMVKLLSEPGAGRIVGCHAYGAHAADMVQEVSSLMCLGATIAQLRTMVHIHPTLGEMVLAAAEE